MGIITCNHCGAESDEFALLRHAKNCPGDRNTTISDLRATIEAKDKAFDEMTDKFVDKLEAKDAEIARWKAAIEGLTPQGSEYVDDPEACAAAIRERCRWPKITIRERQRADAAEARARKAGQILIEKIGAPGPESVDETATRAANRIAALERELARLTAELETSERLRLVENNLLNAALREDKARLDWLDENGDRLADALMTRWIKHGVNIRAAIDDAKGE